MKKREKYRNCVSMTEFREDIDADNVEIEMLDN